MLSRPPPACYALAQGPWTQKKCLHCDVVYCQGCYKGSMGSMMGKNKNGDKVRVGGVDVAVGRGGRAWAQSAWRSEGRDFIGGGCVLLCTCLCRLCKTGASIQGVACHWHTHTHLQNVSKQ